MLIGAFGSEWQEEDSHEKDLFQTMLFSDHPISSYLLSYCAKPLELVPENGKYYNKTANIVWRGAYVFLRTPISSYYYNQDFSHTCSF